MSPFRMFLFWPLNNNIFDSLWLCAFIRIKDLIPHKNFGQGLLTYPIPSFPLLHYSFFSCSNFLYFQKAAHDTESLQFGFCIDLYLLIFYSLVFKACGKKKICLLSKLLCVTCSREYHFRLWCDIGQGESLKVIKVSRNLQRHSTLHLEYRVLRHSIISNEQLSTPFFPQELKKKNMKVMIEPQKLILNYYITIFLFSYRNLNFIENLTSQWCIWWSSPCGGRWCQWTRVSFAPANVPPKGALFHKLQNIRIFKKILRKS